MTDTLVTEYAWQGPRKGADHAVLLAHGAGSDLQGAALRVVADAFAADGIPSLRFNYPYRSAGRKRPRPAQGARRRDPGGGRRAGEAGEAPARTARARRPVDGRPLLLDGRRRRRRAGAGARPADAVVSAPRRREAGEAPHRALPRHPRPILFVSGTRDALAGQEALTSRGEGHPREDVVPLDRHRRPRLPAAEGQRAHHRRRARGGGPGVGRLGRSAPRLNEVLSLLTMGLIGN